MAIMALDGMFFLGYLGRRVVGTEIVHVLSHTCLLEEVVFAKMDWEDGREMRRRIRGIMLAAAIRF